MKRVYIAGKLNDEAVGYIKNINRMVVYAEKVRRYGFAVFIPAVDFLVGVIMGDLEYKDYFDNSQPWMEVSDAVFVVPGWETSNGTKCEIKRASDLDIPVFFDLEALNGYLKDGE